MAAGKKIRLLRSSDMASAGSFVIEQLGQPSSLTGSADTARQARIVESNSEYAIIEVICSCGAKTHIQCNYADMTGG